MPTDRVPFQAAPGSGACHRCHRQLSERKKPAPHCFPESTCRPSTGRPVPPPGRPSVLHRNRLSGRSAPAMEGKPDPPFAKDKAPSTGWSRVLRAPWSEGSPGFVPAAPAGLLFWWGWRSCVCSRSPGGLFQMSDTGGQTTSQNPPLPVLQVDTPRGRDNLQGEELTNYS